MLCSLAHVNVQHVQHKAIYAIFLKKRDDTLKCTGSFPVSSPRYTKYKLKVSPAQFPSALLTSNLEIFVRTFADGNFDLCGKED